MENIEQSSDELNIIKKSKTKEFMPIRDNPITPSNSSHDSESPSSYSLTEIKQCPIEEIISLDIKYFEEEKYQIRKYNKRSIEAGKTFFKYRFIKNKISHSLKIQRKTLNVNQFNTNNNLINNNKITESNSNNYNTERKFTKNKKKHKYRNSLGDEPIFLINQNLLEDAISFKKDEYRKYNSDYLTLVEKSIFNFNMKKYEESYELLNQEEVLKSKKEFGEFLLVISGYDKDIMGEFLAKSKPPNQNKEILKGFIEGLDLNYDEKLSKNDKNFFVESLRFLITRLTFPKDANLILDIMDVYANEFFETNRNDGNFVKKYNSKDAIYLLISTVLALNTMFTRSDIKNINLIKKDQFIVMNSKICPNEAKDIYEKLEKEPLSISEDYNENIYKRMTQLVKEEENPIIDDNCDLVFAKTVNTMFNNKSNTNDLFLNDNLNKNLIDSNNNVPEVKEDRKFSTKKSFSYMHNLLSFSDKDEKILTKPTKFNKLLSKNSFHPRIFLVTDNLTMLSWAKEFELINEKSKKVEIKNYKGTLHTCKIEDIVDVFNGKEKSSLIEKFLSSHPSEKKDINNYITIKTETKFIDIKSDNPEVALSWFKALKSLVIKNKKMKESVEAKKDKVNELIKQETKEIWMNYVLKDWKIYGNYLMYNSQNMISYNINRFKERENEEKKSDLIDEKTTMSKNSIRNFLKEAKYKLREKNCFDFNEFHYFYSLGIPKKFRYLIWNILIGNKCCIQKDTYKIFCDKVQVLDFSVVLSKLENGDNNFLNDSDETNAYNNQIIKDIIELKDFYPLNNVRNEGLLLTKIYRITKVFFLMRPDINYNKTLIPFAFLFLLVGNDEFQSFCNIYNLICKSSILQYFLKNEDFINTRVQFFDDLLKNRINQVREHFNKLDISNELFLVFWFESAFTQTLNFKILLRIFDLYLLNGEKILFQVGLNIIKIQEEELLTLTISEVFKVLKKLPQDYREDEFMEKMFLNNIDQEYNTWKTENELGSQIIKLFKIYYNEAQ